MDFIVSEFISLIKGFSNGLALEKEVWRRGIELQCQTFARALEAYDAELARQYAGKQEVERGTHLDHSCRADLAIGLVGTLYEYISILREPGGQAQEESAGQHRLLSFLGWSTRAIGSGFLVRSRCL